MLQDDTMANATDLPDLNSTVYPLSDGRYTTNPSYPLSLYGLPEGSGVAGVRDYHDIFKHLRYITNKTFTVTINSVTNGVAYPAFGGRYLAITPDSGLDMTVNLTITDGAEDSLTYAYTVNSTLTGAAISFYSGTADLGSVNNPAIAPFGTHAIAGLSDVDPKLLLSELYIAQWDFDSPGVAPITSGARVHKNGGNPVPADELHSPLIETFVFDVPDGQGLTEFKVKAIIKGPGGGEWAVTKSVWVIDQETHYAASDTIYVSDTLPLTENDFVTAGARPGATYLSTPPAYNEYDQKRVLFYGQDVFQDKVFVGLGNHGYSLGSFGGGKAELAGGLSLDVNSSHSAAPTTGSSGVRDDDLVNGWSNNTRVSNLRITNTNFGLSYDHRTLSGIDSDYSNLTTPNTTSGRISFSPTSTTAYNPASGLTISNIPYPTGVYIFDSDFMGTEALTICAGTSSDGNIFDFVEGSNVISYDFDNVTYSPDDEVTLPSFGTMTISANGDYDVNAPQYDHGTSYQIDVLTDDGVKTFYTGQCRPILNMSIMGVEAFGIGLVGVRLKNAREHMLRSMGNSLITIRDCSMDGGSEQVEKHSITLRTIGPNTTNPTIPVPINTNQVYGGQIPFGSGFISSWGGTPRAEYVNGNKYANDCAYWVLAHNHTTSLKTMTGGSASSIQLTSATGTGLLGDQNAGIRDVIVYGTHNTTNEPAGDSQFTTQTADLDNQKRIYVVGWTQSDVDGTPVENSFQNTIIRDRDGDSVPYYRDPDAVIPTP